MLLYGLSLARRIMESSVNGYTTAYGESQILRFFISTFKVFTALFAVDANNRLVNSIHGKFHWILLLSKADAYIFTSLSFPLYESTTKHASGLRDDLVWKSAEIATKNKQSQGCTFLLSTVIPQAKAKTTSHVDSDKTLVMSLIIAEEIHAG
jgi:hypothetical protein